MAKNKEKIRFVKTPQANRSVTFSAYKKIKKFLEKLIDSAVVPISQKEEFSTNSKGGDIENIQDTGRSLKFTFEGSKSFVLMTKNGYQLHGDNLPQRWREKIEIFITSLGIDDVNNFEENLNLLQNANGQIQGVVSDKIVRSAPSYKEIEGITKIFVMQQASHAREILFKNLSIDPQIITPAQRSAIEQGIKRSTEEISDYFGNLVDEAVEITKSSFLLGERANSDHAKLLKLRTNQSDRQIKNFFIQQAHRTNSEVVHRAARDIGLDEFVWKTVENEKVCPICEPRNGKKFSMKKLPKDEWPGFIHPHCNCYRDLVIDKDMQNILKQARS